jgi:hypothetical protein
MRSNLQAYDTRYAALRALLETRRDAGLGPIAAGDALKVAGWPSRRNDHGSLARATGMWTDLYEDDQRGIALRALED